MHLKLLRSFGAWRRSRADLEICGVALSVGEVQVFISSHLEEFGAL